MEAPVSMLARKSKDSSGDYTRAKLQSMTVGSFAEYDAPRPSPGCTEVPLVPCRWLCLILGRVLPITTFQDKAYTIERVVVIMSVIITG